MPSGRVSCGAGTSASTRWNTTSTSLQIGGRRVADKMVKVVGKHVKGCFALKNAGTGFWNTQWGPIAYGRHGHPIVVTERRYGKNGRVYRHWVRFVCNNSECRAEL